MAQIDLDQLRRLVGAITSDVERRPGADETVYLRIGPLAGRSNLRSETHMGADGREVVLDLDQDGLLRGIEFQ